MSLVSAVDVIFEAPFILANILSNSLDVCDQLAISTNNNNSIKYIPKFRGMHQTEDNNQKVNTFPQAHT